MKKYNLFSNPSNECIPKAKGVATKFRNLFQQSLPQFTNDYYWVLFRKKSVPLCLSESYFYNMHLISPYFANLVLNRLKDAYISPQIEMQTDTAFYRICTVSRINALCRLLKKRSLICLSVFVKNGCHIGICSSSCSV